MSAHVSGLLDKGCMHDDRAKSGEGAEDLVRYFRALPEAALREIRVLAEADRVFGEDVVAERRARGQEGE